MNFELRAHTVLLTVAGSRAYGVHTAASDVDVKGTAIPPASYFHGFLHRFEQADRPEHMQDFWADLTAEEQRCCADTKLEGAVYHLVKFCQLAADCNPNMLDVLFCRDAEIRRCTPLGERLRESRDLFLSMKAKHTFSGYAASQLKRIRGHRQWLLHPPQKKPERADYELPERTLIPADQLAAAEAAVRQKIDGWAIDFGELDNSSVVHIQTQIAEYLAEIHTTTDDHWRSAARAIGYDENFILLLDRERRYKSAMREWQQYQTWKTERNPDRARLEAEHGFDSKHGMHLIRLLRTGRELMLTGKVNVWRGDRDAEELLSIRHGAWEYDQLVEEAERIDTELSALYRSGQCVLPRAPDRAALDRLVVDLVETALRDGPGA